MEGKWELGILNTNLKNLQIMRPQANYSIRGDFIFFCKKNEICAFR